MRRKFLSLALMLTGLAIGLGAFGHGFVGRRSLDAGLARMSLDTHTDKLIYLVWYFCGGCMLLFGLLVCWSAWRAWRGVAPVLLVSGSIGVFYVLTGFMALAYMREPFWSVFVILGLAVLVLSSLLGFAQTRVSVNVRRG